MLVLPELVGLSERIGNLGVHRLVHLYWASSRLVAEGRARHDRPESSSEWFGHLGGRLEHAPEDRHTPVRAQHLSRVQCTGHRVYPVP